jgi:6-phosphogluconolactonase
MYDMRRSIVPRAGVVFRNTRALARGAASGGGSAAPASGPAADSPPVLLDVAMPPTILIDAVDALAAEFAARLARAVRRAVRARGRFALAVPGGSVAAALLPRLAGAAIDWTDVDLFWCDERAVPPDHPDSNYGAARRLWLDRLAPPGPRVHRMEAGGGDRPGTRSFAGGSDLDTAAAAYARVLRDSLGDPPRLDMALLGVGPDGHVASLFPGHAALEERIRPVLAIADAPKPPPRRLTLTLPVLIAARQVTIAAFGAEKAAVIRAAIEDDRRFDLPVARLVRAARRPLLLLDPAAAGRLRRPPGPMSPPGARAAAPVPGDREEPA